MRQVNPKVYTKKYYLTDCSGFNEFKKDYGQTLEPRFSETLKYIPTIKKRMKILDIGCGRGELCFWAASLGADCLGIDYSKDAINIAKNAYLKRKNKLKGKVEFRVADANNLKEKNNYFDGVFITEVLEHLYPEEQIKILKNIKKYLKKDGFIFFHTAPSKWFNDYTYRYYCYPISTIIVSISNIITGHKYGNLIPYKKIRTESHKVMHVNEPNYFSLKELFRKSGFEGKISSSNITVIKPNLSWKDSLYNFIVYLYPLSMNFPFNILWGNDFLGVLKQCE